MAAQTKTLDQPVSLSADLARRLRAVSQRLGRFAAETGGVVETLRAVGGVQAQELAAAALAVRARSRGLLASDVDRARLEERSVLRVWAMRGTLHLIAAEDYWLVPLLAPAHRAGSLRRLRQMGIPDAKVEQALQALPGILSARGPLTRDEIAQVLGRQIGLPVEGQARAHLVFQAALSGLVCEGPERGRQPTYLRTEDWLGRVPTRPRPQALAELARRYIAAYGPAGPADLAAWSGLSLGDARQGWAQVAGELAEGSIEGQPAWMLPGLAEQAAELLAQPPAIRLLPRYDTYLLGYASRDLAIAAEFARRVNAGGGIIHPVLLVDGQARGIWRSEERRGGLEIAVEPFEGLNPGSWEAIEAEAADIGRFLGRPAVLRE